MENPPSSIPPATPTPPKDSERSGNIVGRGYMKVEDFVGNTLELLSARKQTNALGKILDQMENIPTSAKGMNEAYQGIFHEFDHLASAINGSPFWADPDLKLENDTVAQQARSLEMEFHHLIKDEQGLHLVLEHMRSLKRSMENQMAVLSQQRERLKHRSSRTRWIMRTVLGGVLLGGGYGTYKYFSAPGQPSQTQSITTQESSIPTMTPQEVEEMYKKQIRDTQEGFRKTVEKAKLEKEKKEKEVREKQTKAQPRKK